MTTTTITRNDLMALESSCIPVAVYQLVNKHVVIVVLSDGFCELFGFDSHEEAAHVMNHNMYRDAHPDDVARVADAAYRFATEGGTYEVVYRTRRGKEGGYMIVHAHGRHVFSPEGERFAVVWYTDEGDFVETDSSSSGKLNHQLNSALIEESALHKSYYDSLTGLPNMSYFFELAQTTRESMTREGKTPAILFVDFNGMKTFNGIYGYAEGDQLIRAVARILVDLFSSENCGHIGQDHFVVITDSDDVEATVRELFAECRTANEGRTLPIRVGIYLDRDDSIGIGAACDRAKSACDMSRGLYYSTFRYFDDSMLARAETRQYLIDNLDRAMDEQWIQVYYQPIVRAANGRVCDEEALARWVDPQKGTLSPAEFIPVLEDTKLIYKLDLYVLEQVLKKMQLQAERGLYVVPTSINLSRSDFEGRDMVEEVRKRVDESGFGRNMITVEITESAIGSDYSFMKRQLERFHGLGFPVWMDDFGSEYSSLDYLQSLSFDLIKLDMRFMQEFENNQKSRIILTELVRMAIGLDVDTICEGVETQEQVEFLREIGCSKLQGFYFTKPLSQDEIFRRYETGTAIGFENPAETDYYTALGKVNLYDLASIARDEQESLQNYFNTLPMAIVESRGDECAIVRCNNSFRKFIERAIGTCPAGNGKTHTREEELSATGLLHAVRRCSKEGGRIIVDERLHDGATIHALVKHLATNPVTGSAALAIAILAIHDPIEQAQSISFAHMARALSSDYIDLYYVNTETDQYVQYSTDATRGELDTEKRGSDFFGTSHRSADVRLYEPDRAAFIKSFTKENVLRALDKHGSFTIIYRLMLDGRPTYVSLKALRIPDDPTHVIVAISNVDYQIRQRLMANQSE